MATRCSFLYLTERVITRKTACTWSLQNQEFQILIQWLCCYRYVRVWQMTVTKNLSHRYGFNYIANSCRTTKLCKESKKMENLIMKTNWLYKLNLELISYYKVWHVVDLQRHWNRGRDEELRLWCESHQKHLQRITTDGHVAQQPCLGAGC